MKKTLLSIMMMLPGLFALGQSTVLTLEECHRLALQSNNSLKISQEKVAESDALKKMALCEMLPRFSANGTYNWNQKSIQLVGDEQAQTLSHMGSAVNSQLMGALTPVVQQIAASDPAMAQSLLGAIGAMDLAGTLNGLGSNVVDALSPDLSNVYAGVVSVAQPVFMGGKLVELYKTARAANEVAEMKLDQEQEALLIQVDEAYWRVVSVQKKQQLAQQYCNLLDTMYHHVNALVEAEMATQADITKVRVKLNEAQMSLAKANSGLALSRMLLYEVCGLDLMGDYRIVEEVDIQSHQALAAIDMEEVLGNRSELRMLEQSDAMAQSAVRIARAGLMPNLVVTGSYVVTNPNLFNGVQNNFGGMFTVGAALNVPICHPTAMYQVKAAKHKRNEVQYQINEARDKITLQVNKLNYELDVANTKLTQARTNVANAEENLKLAQESFAAGVVSSSDLLAAQTAWLQANSELLDASIEVQMDYLYLNQALGRNRTH